MHKAGQRFFEPGVDHEGRQSCRLTGGHWKKTIPYQFQHPCVSSGEFKLHDSDMMAI